MKVRKIYAVYFSATGTTEKTVCRASQAAVRTVFSPSGDFDRNEAYKKAADTERPCPCSQKTTGGVQNGKNSFENSPAAPVKICFNSPDFRRRNLSFKRGDLVFFGVPVYAGRVPNLLLPYLREFISGGGAAAVPIVSYGNRNFDDALKELAQLLERAGFFTAAGGAFVGEHAFSEILGAGRPDAEDLDLADRLGIAAVKKVSSENWPRQSHVPVKVPGEEPLRPYYVPRDRRGNHINILKVKPKTDRNRCTGCGLCASLCPLSSIDSGEPSLITGICMKCGACIKKCPKRAKFIDDPGYLYHRTELEEVYARRSGSRIYI